MPELPEVETIRRGLAHRIVGLNIVDIQVRAPRIFEGEPTDIIGARLTSIERQGKLLIFRTNEESVMTIHLKMTGQLIWVPAPEAGGVPLDEELIDNAELEFESSDDEEGEDDLVPVMGGHPEKSYLDPLPHKHTHVIIHFSDDSTLYFNDLRKFGRISILTAAELPALPFLEKLGPEPLEADFTVEYLVAQLLRHPNQPIKSFLLDQSNIAGLGNIYADESLFRAAILPDRSVASLGSGEISNLHTAIQETLEIALQHGGSSSRDYVDAVGNKGTFLAVANVYHRTGELCNRCQLGIIERKKIGGRSSHYCSVCQR